MAENVPEIIFKKETVNKLLALSFKDSKTKASNDAASLVAEMVKIFVVEATRRAMIQAKNEGCAGVNLEHVEKTLPQLDISNSAIGFLVTTLTNVLLPRLLDGVASSRKSPGFSTFLPSFGFLMDRKVPRHET